MEERLIDFLRRLAGDLNQACQASLVWKDADPAQWSALPADIAQHRQACCLAAKRTPSGIATCTAHCNRRLAGERPEQRLRTCPFGIREIIVPVFQDGHYRGSALIGAWQDGRADTADPAVTTARASLPARDDRQARAVARLATAALAGLPGSLPTAGDDPRLHQALGLIDADCHLGLRAGAVASALGLSTSRFVHWFKDAVGAPYRVVLRERVLRRAAGILVNRANAKIIDIALDLGFASHSAFSAAFRHRYHCTPSTFRRRARQVA